MKLQDFSVNAREINYWLRWLSRLVPMAGAQGLILASWLLWKPDLGGIYIPNLPFLPTDEHLRQTLFIGGVPMLIAIIAWFSPGPAGVVGSLFGLYRISTYWEYMPFPGTPVPGEVLRQQFIRFFVPHTIYYSLYDIFTLGCLVCLFMAIVNFRESIARSPVNKRIHLAAGITCLVSLIATILFSLLVFDTAIGFTFIVWAIIASAIAWFWPSTGGILIVLISIWSLIQMDFDKNISNWTNADIRFIYSILFLIFLAGGILYLLSALRRIKPNSLFSASWWHTRKSASM
jgi:hypothetical protein